ncbi:MAG TPA: hypothetical protein VFI20_09760 [Terracidiphilus sp.]|nr:hypothetical protein [Terracidiphilus sp.]
MRVASRAEADAGLEGTPAKRGGSDLERRYPVALALYGVLGVLIWFTMGSDTVVVFGRPVELRLIPLLIVGTFALRTVVARQADRIRRDGGEGGR